ncbi:MAG TPA: hypothetical protein VLA28_09810 [Afifellaceae bacterium]|nr:hypothetical protein [Afifellaceae bacterium]
MEFEGEENPAHGATPEAIEAEAAITFCTGRRKALRAPDKT